MTPTATPPATPDTLSYPDPIYYDAHGRCYQLEAPPRPDDDVLTMLPITSNAAAVSIRLKPITGNRVLLNSNMIQVSIMPAHARAAVWSSRSAAEVTLTFYVPQERGEEWTWRFAKAHDPRTPAPLILIVKVKRP